MNRLKTLRHRLSLSVDKIAPQSSRSLSPPPVQPWSTESIPSSVSPGPERPQRWRSRTRPPQDGRPLSLTDSSMERSPQSPCPLDQSLDNLSSVMSEGEPRSLVDEVMQEVEKISTCIPDQLPLGRTLQQGEVMKGHPLAQEELKDQELKGAAQEVFVSLENSLQTIEKGSQQSHASPERAFFKPSSLHDPSGYEKGPKSHDHTRTSFENINITSATSTYDPQILTSDCVSDSEEANSDLTLRAKATSPLQKIFRMAKKGSREEVASVRSAEGPEKTGSKKESIYSRLIKSTKRDGGVSPKGPKEPLYARIKPKFRAESSFKPIEPIVPGEETRKGGEMLVKPEPIYSKPKEESPTSSGPEGPHLISPFSSGKQFTPVGPLSPEPVYSSVKRTRTLPLEGLYSRVRRKEAHTLPATGSRIKDPIYTQPLPALPGEEQIPFQESPYGRVLAVKTRETSAPSPAKPSIITISNPGYASATTTSSSAALPSYTTALPSSNIPLSSPNTTLPTPIDSLSPNLDETVEVKEDKENPLVGGGGHAKEESNFQEKEKEAEVDLESESASRLTRLVEELAHELGTDPLRGQRRDLLARLLATYDVPRNLRRVEEADEEDLRLAEDSLLPPVASEELRHVDDEMVYADVPDFSQDEFVIALEEDGSECDSKYASLMRGGTITPGGARKRVGGESPSKVSRRSAQQMYLNVVNVLSALKVLLDSNSSRAASVINRMGTLARPYAAQHPQGSTQQTSGGGNWIQRRLFHKSGHNGFDELRRYIKSGGEFCKELAIVMHERAELETTYAKGLHKLSTKLVKASKDTLGTISEAWQVVGSELEQKGEVHRMLSVTLSEEVVRPLRHLIETQHKTRKGVEGLVDRATKTLQEWRAAELKAKKNCYHNTRENEKIQDMMLEARLGRGKALSEKELLKLEKQRRKAEEAVQRSDLEYYNYCVRTERSRQEWESAVYKGSNCFQTLEEERLAGLKDLALKYYRANKEVGPKLVAAATRLDDPVGACDVDQDIRVAVLAKGNSENAPEQFLPDFYSEDSNNAMNRARRREALEKFARLIRADLDRERRGKRGVENLAKALQETPTFGGEDSQQDVNEKLQSMKAMLAYLEAARYKVQASLDEIEHRATSSHPLAKHITTHRDKQGLPVSVLKVPPWIRGNSADVSPTSDSPPTGSPNWNDRGTADGTSVQPDSDFERKVALPPATINCPAPNNNSSSPGDVAPGGTPDKGRPLSFMPPTRYPSLILPTDEFSSQGSDSECPGPDGTHTIHNGGPTPNGDHAVASTHSLSDGTYFARPLPTTETFGRCKALYDYDANLYDELSIRTGDIINIHEKQADGWWVGEVEGTVGIFPATYVEEID